jgi:hypothetical protein
MSGKRTAAAAWRKKLFTELVVSDRDGLMALAPPVRRA